MSFAKASIGEVFEFVRNGKSVKQEKGAGGIPITRIETISNRTIDPERVGFADLEELGNEKWLLKPGDILFSHINSVEHVGKCALYEGLPSRLIHGMNLLALRPNASLIDPRYAIRVLSAPRFRASLLPFVNKAVNQASVSTANLKGLEIPTPPLDEQRRIVKILDTADALRLKRKRALELLDGLTRSLFQTHFTNCTNRRAKIGDLCTVSSGSTPKRNDLNNFGGNVPWVKTGEVDGRIILETEEMVTEAGLRTARLRRYPAGTILIAMYGQGATRGRVAMLGVEATINQACAAIIPGRDINPVFLFHQLKNCYGALRDLGRGGNQPNLNGELVKSFEVIVPELGEQNRFVATVHEISKNIDHMRASELLLDSTFLSLQSRAFSENL